MVPVVGSRKMGKRKLRLVKYAGVHLRVHVGCCIHVHTNVLTAMQNQCCIGIHC